MEVEHDKEGLTKPLVEKLEVGESFIRLDDSVDFDDDFPNYAAGSKGTITIGADTAIWSATFSFLGLKTFLLTEGWSASQSEHEIGENVTFHLPPRAEDYKFYFEDESAGAVEKPPGQPFTQKQFTQVNYQTSPPEYYANVSFVETPRQSTLGGSLEIRLNIDGTDATGDSSEDITTRTDIFWTNNASWSTWDHETPLSGYIPIEKNKRWIISCYVKSNIPVTGLHSFSPPLDIGLFTSNTTYTRERVPLGMGGGLEADLRYWDAREQYPAFMREVADGLDPLIYDDVGAHVNLSFGTEWKRVYGIVDLRAYDYTDYSDEISNYTRAIPYFIINGRPAGGDVRYYVDGFKMEEYTEDIQRDIISIPVPYSNHCSPADGEHERFSNWVYVDVTFDKPVTTTSNTYLIKPTGASSRYYHIDNNNGKIENLNPQTNGYIPADDHIWNGKERTNFNLGFDAPYNVALPNVESPKLTRWNPRDPELDLGNHAWHVQLGWANNTVETSAAANAFYISGSGTNKLTFGHIANAHSFVTDGHYFLKANTRILSAYGIGDYEHMAGDGLTRALYGEFGEDGTIPFTSSVNWRDKVNGGFEPLGINWDDGSHLFEFHTMGTVEHGLVGPSDGTRYKNGSRYEIAEYSLVGGRSPYGFMNLNPGGKMTQNAAINLGLSHSERRSMEHSHHLYASTWINSDVNMGANVAVFSNTGISV